MILVDKLGRFLDKLSPALYLLFKFIFMTTAVGLFVGDFIIGAGIVASVGIYYILDIKQKQEVEAAYYAMAEKAMKLERSQRAKSDETKGE
jgi:hypothetical protein